MSGFKKIYIEITNRCNLACPFCAQNSRAKVFMAAAAFAEVLRRIHGTTRFISLHVLGEPLLHPEFGQMLAISDEQGMQVNLTTNGTLLVSTGPPCLPLRRCGRLIFPCTDWRRWSGGSGDSSAGDN